MQDAQDVAIVAEHRERARLSVGRAAELVAPLRGGGLRQQVKAHPRALLLDAFVLRDPVLVARTFADDLAD